MMEARDKAELLRKFEEQHIEYLIKTEYNILLEFLSCEDTNKY